MRKNKISKKLAAGTVLAALLLSMSACGTPKAEDILTPPDTEAESEASTTEEVTTEATTEEVILPWAEEESIAFSTEEQSIPYFAFIDDGTFHPMDVGTINQQNATYSVPTATVSEPDEDGNVTYSIQYSIIMPFTATFPMDYQQEVFNGFIYLGMDVMDYYTGIMFPAQNLTDENGHESNLSSDVTWEDVTYTVSVNKNSTQTTQLNNAYPLNDDSWEWDAEYDIDYNIEIIAPKDYDGAILSLNLNGKTEYEEVDSEEVTEAHVFGEEEDEAVSNYVFFRLKDIIQQEDAPEEAE